MGLDDFLDRLNVAWNPLVQQGLAEVARKRIEDYLFKPGNERMVLVVYERPEQSYGELLKSSRYSEVLTKAYRSIMGKGRSPRKEHVYKTGRTGVIRVESYDDLDVYELPLGRYLEGVSKAYLEFIFSNTVINNCYLKSESGLTRTGRMP